MRFISTILVTSTFFLMLSCGGSDSNNDSPDQTWTGYVKCSKRGSQTAINPLRFPLVMTIKADKTFSLVYYYNGKEAMTINGTVDDSNGKVNASVHTDIPYDESSTAKATFEFTTSVGSDGIASGTYAITFDDSSIGAITNESGTIYVTTETPGIAGTWYGGYQGSDGSDDGLVKVTFNDDGTFAATHYESDSSDSDFTFTGKYTLTGSTFNADSSGDFNGEIEDHTGSYSGSRKGSLLINGTYTVNTDSTYTGLWALAKELK